MFGISIYRPRLLLLAVLALAGGAAATRAVAENSSEIVATPLTVGAPSETPKRSQPTAADTILATRALGTQLHIPSPSPTITDSRVWSVGNQRELHQIATFHAPVDSDGPWYTVICDGKFITQFSYPIRGQASFYMAIDTQSGRWLELGPPDFPWETAKIGDVVVQDANSGQTVSKYASGADFMNSVPLCDHMIVPGR